MRSKQWQDLTAAQKRGIVLLGALQLTLLAAALIDIRRRPADAINGSKRLWTIILFVNFIGPIAYFLFGRKRPAPARVTTEGACEMRRLDAGCGVAAAPQIVATDAVRIRPYHSAWPAGDLRHVDLWLRRREFRCQAWPNCPCRALGCGS